MVLPTLASAPGWGSPRLLRFLYHWPLDLRGLTRQPACTMKPTFRTLSHIFSTCWGFATPRDIQHLLFTRAQDRNPILRETTQTGPMTWDRTHKGEVQAAFEKATRKTPALVARLHRLRDWIAAQNLAVLESMTQDEARAALFALESGCLKWHERLPIGIDPQRAADMTGISFCQSWWEGSALRSATYSPGAKKPRRTYQVAKAI